MEKKKQIKVLKDKKGNLLQTKDEILFEVENFYQTLYSSDNPSDKTVNEYTKDKMLILKNAKF